MFCLKCIFVIDVAVKQLRSKSFLKCGVSAVTMAAYKFFLKIKLNLDYTRFIKFVVVPKRGSEWQGLTPRLSAWATQLQRNVVASGRARPRLSAWATQLQRNVVASGRARPRGLAPGQRSSKETSQFGYTVCDLTGLGIESQTFRIDSEIF